MTFMQDSERAALVARQNGLQIGLHLNFTQKFTSPEVNPTLTEHHRRIAGYLNSFKFNQVLYNPFLSKSFDYVFNAQWDEFCRLYAGEPERIDGHHHMHLCANMLANGIIPKGLKVRRSFSFEPREKNLLNRYFRKLVDRRLASQYKITDYFQSIIPINRKRLNKFVVLSKSAEVEIMTHPGIEDEYLYLKSEGWMQLLGEEESSKS